MIEVNEVTNATYGTKEFIVKLRTEAEQAQFAVFMEALEVYSERNERYRDNWRRMGWRGQLVRLRERAERLWDDLWDVQIPEAGGPDDAIDAINFAAFLVRAIRENNRDGSWW